ncbi:MAG: twin-arginine translocase subunit TatC [Deferrisomatales bacterium]|nr:twin-arginine translocase subunit TatC [Deferrisomatales bacterium]
MSGSTTEDTRDPSAEDSERLPFTAHLEELRTRLIKCFAAVILGFAGCYSFSQVLFDFVFAPLLRVLATQGGTLAIHRVQEGFLTHLKISLLAAVFVASPVILYQLWKFVAPGLYRHERRYVWPFVATATMFFFTGASFAYWVVLPFGLEFLLGMAGQQVQNLLSIEEYMAFSTKLLLAFGLVFEMPVVVFFLARMGLVTHEPLARGRGYALIVIVIVAAILTPPDVFTQIMMAVPLYVLYEISIVVARVCARKREEQEAREA